MVLYKIYTESAPDYDQNTRKIVGESFDGYTECYARGVWKGKLEQALIIEILAEAGPAAREKVQLVAERIRVANGQESVLVLQIAADWAKFVTGKD